MLNPTKMISAVFAISLLMVNMTAAYAKDAAAAFDTEQFIEETIQQNDGKLVEPLNQQDSIVHPFNKEKHEK